MNKLSTIFTFSLVALFHAPTTFSMQRLQKLSSRQLTKSFKHAMPKRDLTIGCSVFKVNPKKTIIMIGDLHFEEAFHPSLGNLHRQQALRFLNFLKAKKIDTRYKIEHNKNVTISNDSPLTLDVPVLDAQKHNMHAPPITYSSIDLRKPHDTQDYLALLQLPAAQQSSFYEKLYNKALRISQSAKVTPEAKKIMNEGIEEIYATNIAKRGNATTLPQCMKLYSLPTDAYLTSSMIQDVQNINHECFIVGHTGLHHGVLPAETLKKLHIVPTMKRGLLYRDEVERSEQEVHMRGTFPESAFAHDYLLEAQNHIEEQS